jgi:hypothetical protein
VPTAYEQEVILLELIDKKGDSVDASTRIFVCRNSSVRAGSFLREPPISTIWDVVPGPLDV